MKPRSSLRGQKPSSKPKIDMRAFVVMPIGSEGTEHHLHFKAIYEEHIRPALEQCGYSCKRASDDATAGVITRDVIIDVVESDLVVVDVTTLNPNVLYELGIRHGTVRKGTILICDRGKTAAPPFDINTCRILFYESVAHKIGLLRSSLEKFIQNTTASDEVDSQVFMWTSISEAQRRKPSYGAHLVEVPEANPRDTLEQALTEADQRRMPSQLLERAQVAARDEEVKEFISIALEFLNLEVLRPSVRDFVQLYYLARRVTARGSVTRAILAAALERFPDNREISDSILVERLRSDHRGERDAAREIIFSRLSIAGRDGKFSFPESIDAEYYEGLLPMVLDAMHEDGEDIQALAITTAMIERTPHSTVALRNHARALDKAPSQSQLAADFYKQALLAPDVDDTSALWFASSLAKANRNVEALELIAFALLLDLDEARSFATLSSRLSDITSPRNVIRRRTSDGRLIPAELESSSVVSAVAMAESCPNFDVESRLICERALSNAGYTVDDVQRFIDDNGDQTRQMRQAWASRIYESLATDLTKAGS